MTSSGAMLDEGSAQVDVAAQKAFFEKRRCGKEDSSAGNLEMVNLGPPPWVPTPPPRPLVTGNLTPIVKTNKDYLTGPLF